MKKITAVLTTALLLLAVIGAAPRFVSDRSDASGRSGALAVVGVSETLSDAYELGGTFTLPRPTATVGGKQITAVTTVIFPSGDAYSLDRVTLSQAGKYTLEYVFIDNGKVVEKQKEYFTVYGDAYWLSKPEASAVYNAELPKPGLQVSLVPGAVLSFGHILDVAAFTRADPLFRFYAVPSVAGERDFSALVFTLTDIHDETQTVSFRANFYAYNNISYATAGHNGQLKGHENTANHNIIHSANIGAPFPFSFYGLTYNGNEAVFSLDMVTKQVFANGVKVIDMDDSAYYTNLWEGFTDGRVKLSVTALNYVANSANFVITYAAGADLASPKLTDLPGPAITTEADGKTPLPGAAGGSYKVFSASAYDGLAERPVKTAVYYNYADPSNRVDIGCADGVFKTDKAGVYTIEYSAADVFGNVNQKTVNIGVRASLPALDLAVATQGRVTSGYLGTLIPVAAHTVYTGPELGIGVDVAVTFEGEAVAVTGGRFAAERAGTYAVTYTALDQAGRRETAGYNVSVTQSAHPVFFGEPELEAYYIGGYDYVFPAFTAHDYTSGRDVPAKIKIKVDDGAETAVTPGQRHAVIGSRPQNGTIVITYYIEESGSAVAAAVIERPVINAYLDGKFDAARFFDLDAGVEIQKNARNYTFSTSNSGGFGFIKRQLDDNFGVSFARDTRGAFSAMSLYLTDSLNPEERVKLSLRPDGAGGMLMSVADIGSYAVNANAFSFLYLAADRAFSVANVKYPIRAYTNRRPFTGFSSGMVYFRVEFEGVYGPSAVAVTNFNGQPLNASTADVLRPRIKLYGDLGGYYTPGTEFVVPRAAASDIFDPNITFTLTVTAPDGSVVVAQDGTVLRNVDPSREYRIMLYSVGDYVLTYTAKDKYNVRAEVRASSVTIVLAKTRPVITLDKEVQATAKLGDTVAAPKGSARDSAGNTLRVYRFLVDSYGNYTEITDAYDSVKVTQKGVYTLVYYAASADGEVEFLTASIKVEE
ncbi:MAG: hypothetical protein LBH24_03375 [Clostridiales bacterium]|jgi:hypothetical protein|nr:hypothetical protein [Clostridiales bacterium]